MPLLQGNWALDLRFHPPLVPKPFAWRHWVMDLRLHLWFPSLCLEALSLGPKAPPLVPKPFAWRHWAMDLRLHPSQIGSVKWKAMWLVDYILETNRDERPRCDIVMPSQQSLTLYNNRWSPITCTAEIDWSKLLVTGLLSA